MTSAAFVTIVGRKRHCVRESQRLVLSAEECRSSSDRTIDRHDRDARRIQEPVDCRVCPLLQRADHCFGIHGRCDEQLIAGHQSRPQFRDRRRMLIVPGVQERDHNVGVQRYARHSSRSWSR